MKQEILQGDCQDILKTLPENSVDSIVTDPPYELGFMGKSWDKTGIANNIELWKECLRVLKPGGHLLAFSGTRTYHRMASAIEDAGFEVRDMIEWVYGSGFPKSLNIGKAVDKIAGETGRKEKFTEWMRSTGITTGEINKITNSFMGSHYLTAKEQPAIPTSAIWAILRPHIKIEIPKWVDELVERIEREREVVGQTTTNKTVYQNIGGTNISGEIDITKGTSEWEGWGTALKPAHEPICMARKPIQGTVAENCLKWGTGGINIDDSRVEHNEECKMMKAQTDDEVMTGGGKYGQAGRRQDVLELKPNGRFPANLIHDNSEEVRECFPNESGRFFKSIIYQAKASKSERNKGCEELPIKSAGGLQGRADGSLGGEPVTAHNNHPTVKPVALMEYLIKMVTPKNGVVLDPFAGSGSTGVACKQLGVGYILIENEPEYIEIINKRLENLTT